MSNDDIAVMALKQKNADIEIAVDAEQLGAVLASAPLAGSAKSA
jgi:hypothetical protein